MTFDHVIAIGGHIDYNSTKHHNRIPLQLHTKMMQ